MESGTVAVIGAGTMGQGIAHVFALAGYDVLLADARPEALPAALARIRHNLSRQVEHGLDAASADAAHARIRPLPAPDDPAVAAASVVVEAATEQRDVKAALFQRLHALCPPEAIFATNTSSISITWLGAQSGRPDRFVGMHFFNPVHRLPLVELVRGLETSDATHAAVHALAVRLGKTPVTVQDAPGFVSNRVLMPMINEAFYCLMEGVAGAEDIDTVMRLGMAHPMGPLALADLIGLDVCLFILEVLHRDLGEDRYRPCPLLRRLVDAGRLGRKAGSGVYPYPDAAR